MPRWICNAGSSRWVPEHSLSQAGTAASEPQLQHPPPRTPPRLATGLGEPPPREGRIGFRRSTPAAESLRASWARDLPESASWARVLPESLLAGMNFALDAAGPTAGGQYTTPDNEAAEERLQSSPLDMRLDALGGHGTVDVSMINSPVVREQLRSVYQGMSRALAAAPFATFASSTSSTSPVVSTAITPLESALQEWRARSCKQQPNAPTGVARATSRERELTCQFIDLWEKTKPRNQRPPNEFLCPLSLHAMRDPVCCADGIVYEREFICAALRQTGSSPMTNCAMHRFLFDCKAMVTLMESWVRQRVPEGNLVEVLSAELQEDIELC